MSAIDVAEYSYRLKKGHPIVTVGGKQYLLATGSARSVGNSPVLMGRRDIDPRPSYQGVTVANLRQRLGSQMAGMLGMDLLNPFAVCLYPEERLLRVCTDSEIEGENVAIDVVRGAPVITVEAGGPGGRPLRLVLDTSSALTLVPEPLLRHCESQGSRQSYHPLVGAFRSRRYLLDIAIEGNNHLFHTGILPDHLENKLREDRIDGVLGTDLLEHFGVCLRLSQGSITLGARSFGAPAVAGA